MTVSRMEQEQRALFLRRGFRLFRRKALFRESRPSKAAERQ